MKILKTFKKWGYKLVELVQNLLVPENIKIKKLLDLSNETMRDLLPKSPINSKNFFVLFDYQNKIVRLIIRSIKYKNNVSLRKRIAGYLYEEFLDIASEINLFYGAPPLLLPMPMSKKEKRERGFNQCEELVKEIKKLGGKNVEASFSVLKKIKETERQTKLSREARLKNIKNSMSVPDSAQSQTLGKNQIKNRVVIVLDDVYTTGASISEARRALLSAGAKKVLGLFIAH